uniref:Uncharacterized protein n=1 Tax=Alexandrium monilatum TaxID=311494 RepID=A0A7S4PY23_9DINO
MGCMCTRRCYFDREADDQLQEPLCHTASAPSKGNEAECAEAAEAQDSADVRKIVQNMMIIQERMQKAGKTGAQRRGCWTCRCSDGHAAPRALTAERDRAGHHPESGQDVGEAQEGLGPVRPSGPRPRGSAVRVAAAGRTELQAAGTSKSRSLG